MIALLDPRAWLAGIGLCAVCFGSGYWRGSSSVKSEWRAATQAAEAAQAAEESSRAASIERITHEAQQETEVRRAATARAVAESGRLRRQLADIVSRATVACRSETGADPVAVLSDVLGRADERAGELARIADDARARGIACERAYEALR